MTPSRCFIGDPSVPDSTEDVADRLVAASLAVSRMPESVAGHGTVARSIFGLPPGADIAPGIFNRDNDPLTS